MKNGSTIIILSVKNRGINPGQLSTSTPKRNPEVRFYCAFGGI